MKNGQFIDIFLETLRLIYSKSTPPADFDILLEEAEIDTVNQKKIIKYQDYYISESLMENIVNDQIKKYRLKKRDADEFKSCIYLGPSPRFFNEKKINENSDPETSLPLE